MSFMEAQITGKEDWYVLETNYGTWFVPVDGGPNVNRAAALACVDNEDDDTAQALLEFTEGTELDSVEIVHGYGVRSSAPGYMDCTEWSVYTNKREAMRAYRDEEAECLGHDD